MLPLTLKDIASIIIIGSTLAGGIGWILKVWIIAPLMTQISNLAEKIGQLSRTEGTDHMAFRRDISRLDTRVTRLEDKNNMEVYDEEHHI